MRMFSEEVSDWGRQLQQGESEAGHNMAVHRWSQRCCRPQYVEDEPTDAEKVVAICMIVTALFTQALKGGS